MKRRFLYCAADNANLQEDTPYGKGTYSHGYLLSKGDVRYFESNRNVRKTSLRSIQNIPQFVSETVVGTFLDDAGQIKQVEALLECHALYGCDTIGCLKNRGKQYFWKDFVSSEENILEAFGRLG